MFARQQASLSGLILTLLFHALLLLAILLLWPRVSQHAPPASQRIDVQLASGSNIEPRLNTALTLSAVPSQASKSTRPLPSNKPINKKLEVSMEIMQAETPANATATPEIRSEINSETRTADAAEIPLSPSSATNPSIVGGAAQRQAIDRALNSKSLAQQANEQLAWAS